MYVKLKAWMTKVTQGVADSQPVKLTASSVSSLPKTISNTAITANHEVINCVLSNASAQTSDWTVTTSAGSAVISGSISGSTTITLYLAVPR